MDEVNSNQNIKSVFCLSRITKLPQKISSKGCAPFKSPFLSTSKTILKKGMMKDLNDKLITLTDLQLINYFE